MSSIPVMIVAEITRNWLGNGALISQQFEAAIAHNRTRGYALHSWQFVQDVQLNMVIETIVAVFVFKGDAQCMN